MVEIYVVLIRVGVRMLGFLVEVAVRLAEANALVANVVVDLNDKCFHIFFQLEVAVRLAEANVVVEIYVILIRICVEKCSYGST